MYNDLKMNIVQIEIDNGSGFCFGVTTAIKKAEEELAKGGKLYCLGDIVHNGMEVERLHEAGLITIDHEQMEELQGVKVLLRAHGEPPETYALAERNNIEIIDATCPVVLQLQRRIKKQYVNNPEAQIVIFGKNGHAEVLGLVGQTESHAIVVEKFEDVKQLKETGQLDFSKDIYLYSQTLGSLGVKIDIFTPRLPRVSMSSTASSNIARSILLRALSSRVSIPSAVRWLTACLTSLPLPASMMSSSL